MSEPHITAVCADCRRPIPANASGGLCARCLFETALNGGPVEAPRPDASEETALPRSFGGYELLEEIARGGMGIVYRAHQKQLNRFVALKLLRDSGFATPQARQRFQIEAEAAARLEHPNIVPIYEFGTAEGQPFISMKLVEGPNLNSQLRGVPMEAKAVARLMATLAHAIHFAHQRGVIHRDLKPANVLLDARNEPQVTDFGLAKRLDVDSSPTLSSDVLGSPNYMAPEQAAGRASEVTTAADVYSLGAIMYELLTGRAPFRSDTPLETIRKVVEEEPIAPRLLYKLAEPDLQTICLKCMQKEPAHRYSSAEALAEDLTRWLNQEPILARPPTPRERVIKWMRRNPRIATLTTLLLIALAAGLGAVLFMNVRLTSANHEKEAANIQLSSKLRDFEWVKVEELVSARKWNHALAFLNAFLRENPRDQCAASRAFSMLNSGNFCLPAVAPLQHGASVSSVAVSTDGRRVLTAADDGMARLWDLESGRLLVALRHPVKVSGAFFAADERLVLTSCQDGSFRLWDTDQTKVLFEFPKALNSRCPPALSRDRRRVALPDTERSVRVWDIAAQRPLSDRLELGPRLTSAQFSSDPNIIAVTAENGRLGVWRVEDSHPLLPVQEGSAGEGRVSFSPDGAVLAAASGRTLTLWDTKTWTKIRESKVYESGILMIEFATDGQRLLTASFNDSPRIWDVATGKLTGQPIPAEQPHCYVHISPDGNSVATRSQSGVVRIWDAKTGLSISEPFYHEGPVTDLAFTPDGQLLLTASQDGTVQVLSIQHSRPSLPILKTQRHFASATFTRDGRFIVGTDFVTAHKFDAGTGEPAGKPMTHPGHIYRIKTSPDCRKLVTAGYSGSVRIWNLETCEPLLPDIQHPRRVAGIAFSPDNRLLATACEDGAARLWDAETGQTSGPLLQHDGEVLSVVFRNDSHALLTTSLDGTVRLWNTEDGKPIWPEPIHHKGIVWQADFDGTGRRVVSASADGSAMVSDGQTGQALIPPVRHERSVSGAGFSPDGRWILTWSADATARVWDAYTGEPISEPMRHREEVFSAAFSPDGTRVLTGSKEGVVRLWDSATGYPVSEPIQCGGPINSVQFSPDGRYFLAYADQDALRTWRLVAPPVPVPPWFCDFLQAVAGRRLTARREVQAVGRDSLPAFRQRFATSQDSDFYSRWAKWFLWSRMKDSPAEFVPE